MPTSKVLKIQNLDIDEEWEKFISKTGNSSDDECFENEENFQSISENGEQINGEDGIPDLDGPQEDAPKASDIYISTKSKIAYLNTEFDLKDVFWAIPVIPYAQPTNGVIKKQIKFNSSNIEELNIIHERLKSETYYEEHIITSINNPSGRIKFKDIRKVSIGISKKDIMSYRRKKKSAFYNCFVMILRVKIGAEFKEFHIKVFNTGKMEIRFREDYNEIVLINSNFNCGFYINREALADILKYKYNIQSIYDPTSYPGIQCKFYYHKDKAVQNGSQISEEDKKLYKNVVEVSFMIFRTGSILIVGMCDDNVLYIIYEYLKNVLAIEYHNIHQKLGNGVFALKDKKKKVRRKCITIHLTSGVNNGGD